MKKNDLILIGALGAGVILVWYLSSPGQNSSDSGNNSISDYLGGGALITGLAVLLASPIGL
jgi:hypothetical protein